MRVLRLALALAACVPCGACSYALMRPAPVHHEQLPWVECTSSRVAPVADSVGVVQGVGVVLAVQVFDGYGVLGEGDREVSTEGRVIQVAALGVAAVYLASSIHGFGSATDCEHAKGLATMRQLEQANAEANAPAPAGRGCSTDPDCKAGRRCLDGRCAWPSPAAPSQAAPSQAAPSQAAPSPEATVPASPPAPAP